MIEAVVSKTEQEFDAAVAEFVRAADELTAGHSVVKTHRADYISDKWVRVMTLEARTDGPPRDVSVYGFIARVNFANKAMGQVVRGGIYRPASYKVAAKHARGSIFSADFRAAMGEYGPVYLK